MQQVRQISKGRHILYTAAAIAGGLLLTFGLTAGIKSPIGMKLIGRAPHCPWDKVLSFMPDSRLFGRLGEQYLLGNSVIDRDNELGIELVQTSRKAFWTKSKGEGMNGRELIAYLLAEHDWMAALNPDRMVRPGDVVLDCGAHVGTFAFDALERGASKVVAIEPDPVNLECLRRNFREEIAAGKVVIVPMGVWSSNTTLSLDLGVQNSGANTFVRQEGGGFVEVPVTTIDDIAGKLELSRVDFIKMDIEGAERHALRGGTEVLKQWKPRILLESYHLLDDMEVLPRILLEARADYGYVCGPCDGDQPGWLVPHVTYWE